MLLWVPLLCRNVEKNVDMLSRVGGKVKACNDGAGDGEQFYYYCHCCVCCTFLCLYFPLLATCCRYPAQIKGECQRRANPTRTQTRTQNPAKPTAPVHSIYSVLHSVQLDQRLCDTAPALLYRCPGEILSVLEKLSEYPSEYFRKIGSVGTKKNKNEPSHADGKKQKNSTQFL